MGIKGTKLDGEFVLFYGFTSPFSNFYQGLDAEFTYKGHVFSCSEQAYMWEKANFSGDTEIANEILNANEPSRMKHLGYKIAKFNEEVWEKEKYNIMVQILKEKFKKPKLKYDLKCTLGKTLVESSTNKVWGSGFYMNNDYATVPEKWKGENLLGKALREVRNELFPIKEV